MVSPAYPGRFTTPEPDKSLTGLLNGAYRCGLTRSGMPANTRSRRSRLRKGIIRTSPIIMWQSARRAGTGLMRRKARVRHAVGYAATVGMKVLLGHHPGRNLDEAMATGLHAPPWMAGIAQLVERQVVVLDVTGSSPVARPTAFL